jgi:hypothetical protein
MASISWNNKFFAAVRRGDDPFRAIDLADEWKRMQNLGNELSRATETIERQLQDINDLQDEVARLRILWEEGSGDIAARLVTAAVIEETKKHTGKVVSFVLSRDYTMTLYGTRFKVSIREVD